jgi:hypothetical protein
LYKRSISEHKLPQTWKNANITAIFKKGSRKQAGNYRPVSLTSILCKTLESIVRDGIMEHMNDNKLFTQHQYGFRRGRSCVTQLLEIMDHWTDLLDEGKNIDVIYLDFQKAFDTVPHMRLLKKMEAYGICGEVLAWVKGFLETRNQRVVLGKDVSDWKSVKSGVPQGNVLGPVLFLIFINDLPTVVKCFVKLFADDTKSYTVVRNECDRQQLQRDLDSLCQWSNTWLLKFNAAKCKVMHIGRTNPNLDYFMTDQTTSNTSKINVVSEEKDLGVTFDPSLKFSKHIANCAAKANKVLV